MTVLRKLKTRISKYLQGWWNRHVVADYPYEGKL